MLRTFPGPRVRPGRPGRSRVILLLVLAVVSASLLAGLGSASASKRAAPAQRISDTRLESGLKAALRATSYPGLSPRLGNVKAGEGAELLPAAQCLNPDDIYNTDQCNYGPANAPKTAVVIGDSVAASYLAGLTSVLVPRGYRVHGLMLPGCPVADVQMSLPFDTDAEARCNSSHDDIYRQVQLLHPDLLVMTGTASSIQRLKSGNRGEDAVAEWKDGETRALLSLSAPGRKMLILGPNPTGPDPKDCLTATSRPHRCEGFVQSWYGGMRKAENSVAATFGVTYTNTSRWFCLQGRCPVFALGTPMRWDGSHITRAYSLLLTGHFRRAIVSAGG